MHAFFQATNNTKIVHFPSSISCFFGSAFTLVLIPVAFFYSLLFQQFFSFTTFHLSLMLFYSMFYYILYVV